MTAAKNKRAAASAALDSYIRQAKHYGTEMVFETAAGCMHDHPEEDAAVVLPVKQLAALAVALGKLDPTWKLPEDRHVRRVVDDIDGMPKMPGGLGVLGIDRAGFALELASAGVTIKRAGEIVGLSVRTLRRAQRELRPASRFGTRPAPRLASIAIGDFVSKLAMIEIHNDGDRFQRGAAPPGFAAANRAVEPKIRTNQGGSVRPVVLAQNGDEAARNVVGSWLAVGSRILEEAAA